MAKCTKSALYSKWQVVTMTYFKNTYFLSGAPGYGKSTLSTVFIPPLDKQ